MRKSRIASARRCSARNRFSSSIKRSTISELTTAPEGVICAPSYSRFGLQCDTYPLLQLHGAAVLVPDLRRNRRVCGDLQRIPHFAIRFQNRLVGGFVVRLHTSPLFRPRNFHDWIVFPARAEI